jgi:hypothetical protein
MERKRRGCNEKDGRKAWDVGEWKNGSPLATLANEASRDSSPYFTTFLFLYFSTLQFEEGFYRYPASRTKHTLNE